MYETSKKPRSGYDPLLSAPSEPNWYENAVKKNGVTTSELTSAQHELLGYIEEFHAEQLPTFGDGESIPGEEAYDLGEVAISTTAHEKIRDVLTELLERMQSPPDINNLNASEWCLREILTQADIAITSGRCTINLVNLSNYMIASLRDEGIEKWEQGFNEAVLAALELFKSSPDN